MANIDKNTHTKKKTLRSIHSTVQLKFTINTQEIIKPQFLLIYIPFADAN